MTDIEVQVFRQAEADLCDVIGRLFENGRFVGQGDATDAEVSRLPDRCRYQFAAGCRVEDARRHANAHLVRIRDTVDAEVTIGSVQ